MLTVPEFKAFVDLNGIKTVSKKRGKQTIEFLEDFSTGDLEVTTIPDYDTPKNSKGLPYIWMACVFGHTVKGRTIDEFKSFCLFLYKKLHLSYKRRLVMFFHNLEYDFTFISGAFNFKEIFATNTRAVLYAYACGIEFRCSYKLTNMSLAEFTKQMGVEHVKLSGDDFDYRKIRTPDTELSDEELAYCEHDVLGLYEAIKIKMQNDGDNIATIPYTSTGYVRRDCRNAMRQNRNNHILFCKTAMPAHIYSLAKKAFRGGNCHANRERAGKIEKDLVSFDIASSYPSVLMYGKYACGPFRKIDIKTPADIKYLFDKEYACLFDVTFVEIHTEGSIPYIPLDKCEEAEGYINDNGRILKADHLRMVINEDDLYIILDSYEMKTMVINEAYYAETDYLPMELRNVISKYFEMKTRLKGVVGSEYMYAKSKNLFNAIFGMTVQDPVHPAIKFLKGKWSSIAADTQGSLDKFYNSENSFLPYQWGVAVTSKARRRLYEAIKLIDNGRPAKDSPMYYCDTDSVKFIREQRAMDGILAINARIKAMADKCPCAAKALTKNGDEQILGLWDYEADYINFLSYGAKKYAYTAEEKMKASKFRKFYQKNKNCIWDIHKASKGKIGYKMFHITVSGLNKEKGANEIKRIENFKLGLTVNNSGRTISVYDDDINPHFVTVNGKDYKIYANIAILDTTYTLGVTPEYGELAPNIFTGSIYDEEVDL